MPADAPATPPPIPKKKRWRKTKRAVPILAVLAATPFVAVVLWEWSAKRDVLRQLAELRAAGVPTTAKELAASYRVPEGEKDATEEWLTALKICDGAQKEIEALGLESGSFSWSKVPKLAEEWPIQDAAICLLDRHRAIGEEIDRLGARAESVRFPIDFGRGFDVDLSHIQLIRAASYLEELRIYVAARTGDSTQAVRGIHRLHVLADILVQEPQLVSYLTRNALHSRSYRCFEQALSLRASDGELDSLRTRWEGHDFRAHCLRALQGERVVSFPEVLSARFLADELEAPWYGRPLILATRWHDAQAFLERFQSLVRVVSHSTGYEALQRSDAIFEQLNKEEHDKVNHPMLFTRVMTHLVMPSSASMVRSMLRIQAENDICLTLIAAEQFRRKNGQWPETLASLVPDYLAAVPADPFDGQALKYKVNGDEIVVYTVWHNGDDGGDLWTEGPEGLSQDYSYRIKAPAAPANAGTEAP